MAQRQVLSIKNLNHAFGQGSLCKQVLFDINLELYSGEITILTGPSGCGKTTMLTLIGGLRSVQAGSLKVVGQELRYATSEQLVNIRRQIGYIFQAHNLLKCLTAQQNVQMSIDLHDEVPVSEPLAVQILKAVGLGDYIDCYPENLSGGQKQRVAIARALVSHPTLVLADEPTAALDSKSGRNVVELMQQLAREQGSSILMVTHDRRILDIADRILEMEDGRLLGYPVTSAS